MTLFLRTPTKAVGNFTRWVTRPASKLILADVSCCYGTGHGKSRIIGWSGYSHSFLDRGLGSRQIGWWERR